MDNTYWDGKGTYKDLYDQLRAKIPVSGPVAGARKNKALEKLRRAANCYYDLYNNGLYNRAEEFRRVFGFGGTAIAKGMYSSVDLMKRLEQKMDDIIIAAAVEQRIDITPYLGDEISEQEVG